MIKLDNIYKWVSTGERRFYLLKALSLQVGKGEFVSIMGPSGSGKSTLLHTIALLDSFNEGSYFFNKEPVHQLNTRKRNTLFHEQFGFIFQAYHLLEEQTVYENIETPLIYKKVKKPERQSRVAEMLDRFNIVGKKDLFPSQLSGGQQQLVGIARALVTEPTIILADEPTGNLNSAQGKEIMELFARINQAGVTIIQATHSEENAAVGNRVIRLLDGMVQRE